MQKSCETPPVPRQRYRGADIRQGSCRSLRLGSAPELGHSHQPVGKLSCSSQWFIYIYFLLMPQDLSRSGRQQELWCPRALGGCSGCFRSSKRCLAAAPRCKTHPFSCAVIWESERGCVRAVLLFLLSLVFPLCVCVFVPRGGRQRCK